MNLPSSAQVHSALRHVYTATAAAGATAIALGVSPQTWEKVSQAVQQIGDGVASIAAGLSTLVPIAMAAYAAWSASRKKRMQDLSGDPEIRKIETVPGTPAAAEAAAIPSAKVV